MIVLLIFICGKAGAAGAAHGVSLSNSKITWQPACLLRQL